jgi:ferric-dicitrate binding protein FerR (iron transport regulator)
MDYSQYDIADFAADDQFVSWVIQPNEQLDAFWLNWSERHPQKAKVLYEARLMVLLMNSRRLHLEDTRKEELWNSIQEKAFLNDAEPPVTNSPAGKRFARTWTKIAATLLIVLVSLSIVHFADSTDQMIVHNPKGKKSILYLPDGTKVWLNAESRLSYPASFENRSHREVELEGEAFFDVTENKNQPFIVKTSKLQVRVLGTSFNVKSFQDEGIIETTLVRGSVLIELNDDILPTNTEKALYLKENEQAVYSTASKELLLRTVKTDSATSWKEGRLTFMNAPFSEIEQELERWYGVNITIDDDASAQCRFSTTIDNEPISKILELFRTTSGITYEIEDNIIRIKGSLCHKD